MQAICTLRGAGLKDSVLIHGKNRKQSQALSARAAHTSCIKGLLDRVQTQILLHRPTRHH